ncbi:Cadmium, cobalt and zinc/H(+)-K(+) antiporter [bioreactor metagenome]|uniref:Cadmium, cobalt and zinc/H(+)-K(+) antiporter n=1 Tax=bioreactor metagenome TaxID=1076179 RepID=A0A644X579_9ZZZZ
MGHNHERQENIKVAFLLNLTFTIFEIVGGLWTNSMAILTDALHDLGDSISLGVSWYLEKYSEKGPDQKFSYGYARFSLLGALISSVVLLSGSVLIITRAIPRIIQPEAVNPKGMLIFSILGIVINGTAVLRLKKGTSLNEKVVSWHLIEDVLGWIVVLIISVVLIFLDLPVLDPIFSLLITIYVLYNVVKNLKEILNIFLQGVPKNLSIKEIEKEIVEKIGAVAAYHTHIWSMEGERHLLSINLIVNDEIERNEVIAIKQNVRKLMMEKEIDHVTVQVDFESEDVEDYY